MKDASGSVRNGFTSGENITFELTVSNLSNASQPLTFPDAQLFDFLVGRDSQLVWNWAHDKGFAAVVTELEFGPLETKTFTAVWNQSDNSGAQIAAGTYKAQGFLATAEEKFNLGISPESEKRSPVSAFTVISLQPYIDLARSATFCTDIKNRLLLIDRAIVLWDTASNCPDNGFSVTLFGETPDKVLCDYHDSIAGPVKICNDQSKRQLFDTVLDNLSIPDLGLGAGHTVEQVMF